MAIVKYIWPEFTMTYNTATGNTTTMYNDGCCSGCDPVPDDQFHALQLGITDKLHRLNHELIHHLLALYHRHKPEGNGSEIVYHDAHQLTLDARASMIEEWKVTAFQYFMFDKNCQDYGALLDLSREVDLMKLKQHALWLFNAARLDVDVSIQLQN
jgi:hypothetical protein